MFSALRRAAAWTSIAALLVALAAGCSSNAADDDDKPDARPPRPPDGGSENWDRTTVDDSDVGMHTKIAVKSDGTAAVAYYSSWAYEDGTCDELDDPPIRMIWDMHYAEETGSGWNVELVEPLLVLGIPPGLDFQISPSGTPLIAAMTGEPVVQIKYCGSNDVGLYSRTGPGSWSVETAVADSGEAATGLPASDYGYVVGHWPTLAFDQSGNPAIAYRDVHAGAMQGDDDRKADLELAWKTGGWAHIAVDPGHGAGQFSKLLFDDQNRPVIVYVDNIEETTDNPQGTWVARSEDGGTTWDKVRLVMGSAIDGPDAAIDDDGTLHVVYYDSRVGVPKMVTLTDDAQFTSLADGWTTEVLGDSRYDEGYNPAIAVGPQGQLAIAYYRCTVATSGLGNCDGTEDGIVFAWQEGGGWESEVIDPGATDLGTCGTYPALAFDGNGHAVAAYQCQAMVSDALVDEVHFARRDLL